MHLFISHSTKDGAEEASALVRALEAAGQRCWIARRDVSPGVPYPRQIVQAIEGAAGLVLLVTPGANESSDVLQEVQLANQARKTIAPVIVSGCAPSSDLRYFLGVRHQIPWTDADGVARAPGRTFVAPSPPPQAPNSAVILGPSASEELGNQPAANARLDPGFGPAGPPQEDGGAKRAPNGGGGAAAPILTRRPRR
jgi:hypothetical protein